MAKLMDQTDDIDAQLFSGSGIMKWFRYIADDIIAEPLPAVADAIDTATTTGIAVHFFARKRHDEIVVRRFFAQWKVLL